MVGKFAPLLIGLIVWAVAEAILKRKRDYVLLLVCIVAAYVGLFAGVGLVLEPSAPMPRVITASLIASTVAAAIAAYIYSLIVRPPPEGS